MVMHYRIYGVHWPLLTMSFVVGEMQVILKGDPSFTKSKVSLKATSKVWKEDQGFLIEFQHLEMEGNQDMLVKSKYPKNHY